MAEEDLVAQAKRGDPQAWAQLYECYYDRLYRYIYFKVEDAVVAEDVSSQVFLKALEALPTFSWRGTPFSAWLFRIARNLVIDQQRKGAAERRYISRESHFNPGPNAVEEVERKQEREQVAQAVARLTPMQQEVIRLRFASELSTAETARAIKKSIAAVKALQHSALVALRKVLSDK